MAENENTSRWSDDETIVRTVHALEKAGDDLSSVLLLLRVLEARGISDATVVLAPLQSLVSSLDEIEPFVARHGGAARSRAVVVTPTLLERLAAFEMPTDAIPDAETPTEQLPRAVNEGLPSSTAGRPDRFIAAARSVAATRRAEDELFSEIERLRAQRASLGAAERAAESQLGVLGRLPAGDPRPSSFAPSPSPVPPVGIAVAEGSSSMASTSARPASLATGLRNVVACALGGAVIAGMLLGHRMAGGVDPRYAGAAVGAVAGLLVWAVRGF